MAAGDREGRHPILEMAQEVDVVEQRAHRLRHVGMATPQMFAPDRDEDVLSDRHVGEQGGMLMNDRDPELLRDDRGEVVDWRAVDHDPAVVLRHRTRGDVHQRRLACAVFSEEGVHLSRKHVERDVREGGDGVEMLGDAVHRQRRLLRCLRLDR